MARVRTLVFLVLTLGNPTASLVNICSNEMDEHPALALLFSTPAFADESPCALLSPQPSFEALRSLQDTQNMGLPKEEPDLANYFIDLYLTNRGNPVEQLRASTEKIMELRDRVAQKLKRSLEEEAALTRQANEILGTDKSVHELTSYEFQKKAKNDPSFESFDHILMSQILKFKEEYFSNHYVVEFNPKTSTARSFIFAILKPAHPKGKFELNLLIDGRPFTLRFSKDSPYSRVESSDLLIEPITPPAEVTRRFPPLYHGQEIQFFWANLPI